MAAGLLCAAGCALVVLPAHWRAMAQWIEEVFKNKDFALTIVSHTEPMDINIYAKDGYYFQYDNPDFKAIMAKLDVTTDTAMRSDLLKQAQTRISEDYVNAYLFELAFPTVAKAGLKGLWKDQPTAAVDLTALSWAE